MGDDVLEILKANKTALAREQDTLQRRVLTTESTKDKRELPSGEEHVTSESKNESKSEPMMPAQIPSPLVEPASTSRVVEDPFADMLGKDGSEKHEPSRTLEGAEVSSQPSSSSEVKTQGIFDAFPAVGETFESDPFSVNGYNGNGVESGVDDPFSATDAVFSSATAAAGEGFDAFPSSEAGFDAFAQ